MVKEIKSEEEFNTEINKKNFKARCRCSPCQMIKVN